MKVFILGLDGATYKLLDPLMAKGLLPNLKEIYDNYAAGPLKTIMPPVTGPAWLALATGLNPGKTGVFDYINKVTPAGDKLAPVSSKNYEGRAIWNHLNSQGLKTGIFNYPTLIPAPKVDGFAVGGIGARWDKQNLCYPVALYDEIQEVCGDYTVLLNLRSKKYEKRTDLFFDDIHRILDNQTKVMKHLIRKKSWDFFFGVLSVTDWVQHVVWKDIDPDHPLYNKQKAKEIEGYYNNFWVKIDDFIGDLQKNLPDDCHLMIVSDHGFGPLNSVFYPNSWLEKEGWLLKKKGMKIQSFLTEKIKMFSESFDNKYSHAIIHRIKSRFLKIDNAIDFIDLENSLVYSPEHNTMFGCVNLTEKGKNKEGFKDQLIKALKELPDKFPPIRSVEIVLPENVYQGPHVNLSPDIFFIINDYEATVEIPFDKRIFSDKPSVLLRTGSHRSEGIFMAKGPIFKNIKVKPSILDIAPTILALFKTDIPDNIDGNVLVDTLKDEFVKKIDIKVKKTSAKDIQDESSEEELEKMKEMLKNLGYL
jgi:predicted AlkP superfamily phosphohydrolase/phosphomutase